MTLIAQCRILVVSGAPASGKTILAQAIARRAGVVLLGKDMIKEPLLDVLGAADRAASRALSDASFAVQFALAAQVLRATPACVLEGNFRPEHAQALIGVLGSPGHAVPRVVQLACYVSGAERRARLIARARDPTRHPGHRDADVAADPVLEVPTHWMELPGERLQVETGSAGSAMRERFVTRLASWLRADPAGSSPRM